MEHPLEKFAYCPICGSKHFIINNFKSKRCESCGFVYYANPCAATAAFIVNDRQEMLVVRRAKEPAKGTLDLPGGFVDMYETAEEGMRREIKEETGLEVDHIEYLFSSPNVYMYSGLGVHTIDMDYLYMSRIIVKCMLPTMPPHVCGYLLRTFIRKSLDCLVFVML